MQTEDRRFTSGAYALAPWAPAVDIHVCIFHGGGDIQEFSTTEWREVFAWVGFYAGDVERLAIGHRWSGPDRVHVARGPYVHIIIRREED